jgi:hypothetical protein
MMHEPPFQAGMLGNEQLHQPQSSTEFLKQNMGMGRLSFEHGVVFVYGEFLFLSSR